MNPSAACSACFASSSGNSSRQGTQLGPQKLTTTGLPAEARQVERGAVERRPDDGRRRLADCHALVAGRRPGADEHDGPRPSSAAATRSARRIGRRGIDRALPTGASRVPVMFEWMLQTYV